MRPKFDLSNLFHLAARGGSPASNVALIATIDWINLTVNRASARRSIIFLSGFLCLLATWIYWIDSPAFPLDDAYIVQHTVDGILNGGDNRFLDSKPMDGATSPAHILLTLILSTVAPTIWAQVLAMTVGIVLYVTGIYSMVRGEGVDAPWARILTAYSVMLGLTLLQLLNGLETALAMAAIAWTLFLFRNPRPANPLAYALLGALPFIRPELIALSGLFYLRSAWAVKCLELSNKEQVKIATFCALGAVPFMLFLAATTGSVVPNTVAAKLYFFAEGCLPNSTKYSLAVGATSVFLTYLGAGSLGFIALLLTGSRWITIGFIVIFWLTYSARLPGALHHNEYRYLHILIPLAIFGWAAWLANKSCWIRRSAKVILFFAVIGAAVDLAIPWRKYTNGLNFSKHELHDVSIWAANHVPANDVILIHDAGYISTIGSQPLVDLVGLKTASSVEIHRRSTWATCSRRPEAIHEIALAGNAKYMIVLTDWDRIFKLTAALKKFNWAVDRADPERGGSSYKVFRITPPTD